MAADSLHEIALKDIDGKDGVLAACKGKVTLIVNVASECGYTPQYVGLQTLFDQFKDKGFTVLGVPCNDFGGQEPGSAAQIKTFCTSQYSVTFPMTEKVAILGDAKHPLYALLTGDKSPAPGDVQWNFTKFLVGKDGTILKRFESDTEPNAAELTAAIEAALAK
ncbi:MAG: glutathione peroxidase [Verrucomicrobiales bacterium]|nr:glutathione peroxidase [Verrucomicrobiales bacterium]MCP5556530.1 glutathione peroxidase [Verrucomicrobiaceae bacterium]